MGWIEVVFWVCVLLVIYTYVGYGLLLYVLVKVKELFRKPADRKVPDQWPEITLLIAAYNEESVIEEKMANCRALQYPQGKLTIAWVTDGSTDGTDRLLSAYPGIRLISGGPRAGKAAAFNRAMLYISTPITVYTDANTMLNPEAILEIAKAFSDPRVGCVAGEKRVVSQQGQGATAGEGIYWKYESVLKALDDRLYTTVGAAGELFAIRTPLYIALPPDTLLDDFILSMEIARRGYKIAYCKQAYACETASADMREEAKRKVRIAAGGLQSIGRLRGLLNVFRYGTLSFQYISRKVLRWSAAPVALFLLVPLNILLVAAGVHVSLYGTILGLQVLFYAAAVYGYLCSEKGKVPRWAFVPYYFLFMNANVIRGMFYLRRNKGKGTWEKARRG